MATYLDYNATAPLRPEVLEKVREILAAPNNPSSAHSFGRAAKKHLEAARKTIADYVSAWPDEVIFTASGTEANVMALRGVNAKQLFISAVEHSSVLKARDDASIIPAGANGVIDLAALDALLAKSENALVSVMLANNETGAIQPVAEAAAICKKHNALLHCDVVQALGKISVDMGSLGCDLMTIAAHKCGGPVGVGALVARRHLPVEPLLKGGSQEMNRRAGTVNVAAIAGFAVALERASDLSPLRGWLDAMEDEMIAQGATVFSKSAPRLPNTSYVAAPGIGREVQLMDFDLKGFAISAGSACASGRTSMSHVLAAMHVPETVASCAIRISGGWQTTEQDIKLFTQAWLGSCERLAKAG